MAERVIKCPQCNAPLTPPSRFAKSVVCGFCATTVLIDDTGVSAQRYRDAHREWNDPSRHGFTTWGSIGSSAWAPLRQLASGEISDVFLAQRARTPTERVVLKVLRDASDAPLFDREVQAVEALGRAARSAAGMLARLPQLVAHGTIHQGFREGARAIVYQWPVGYRHTLEDVRRAHPSGVDPRVAVWMWRRALELLAFMHRADFVHGALLPQHLLVEDGEHGLRFAGFNCAVKPGARVPLVQEHLQAFYPRSMRSHHHASTRSDIGMSARCMVYALGGDPESGVVPASVPDELAALLRGAANETTHLTQAWSLREEVGHVARRVFGPPSFHPLVMPRES